MSKERELLKRVYEQFATVFPSEEEEALLQEIEELLAQPEPEPIYSVGKRWQCDVALPEEGKKLEIDILKAKIEDLKNDNLILKQTLLQAQKEYSDKDAMTLRDHFAGLAMQGLLSADLKNRWGDEDCAKFAYQQADAMLKERGKIND